MSETVISVENLSKHYQLGVIGTGTVYGDIKRWWAKRRGKPDPYLKIGEAEHGNREGETIWALKDVNFSVRRGEALGIIGRNGAGKSTLLKVLSQVTAPTSGIVKVKGRIASLLEVGTGFHPELTGRENIYLNGAIMGMKRDEISRKFDEIVDFSGVERFIDTPVKRYSSGMYVRLAFAVAAHLEPEILIVDEVLAVGDAAFQQKCLGKMDNVAQHGRTVIFVSHNMTAIQSLCSSALLFSKGRIKLCGDTNSVIDSYLVDARSVASQDLEHRTDRSGSQRLLFTKIAFEDSDQNSVQELVSGQDVKIVLDYEADSPLKNVVVNLGLYNNLGQFLLMCNNEISGYRFEALPAEGQIRCHLPKLPLAAGTYIINIYCEVNGILADWVREATVFNVLDGDFYGTGKNLPASHGGVLTQQIWSSLESDGQ